MVFLHNLKNKSFFAVLCTVECIILQESAKELEKKISLILITDYTLFLFHALNYITGVKNVFFCPEFSFGRGSLFWRFLSVVCDIYIYVIKCSHPCLFFYSYIITVISRNFILTNYRKILKISPSMYKPLQI